MKTINLFVLIGLLTSVLYGQLPPSNSDAGRYTVEAKNTSIVCLLANPAFYQGKGVRIVGYLTGDNGGAYVFLTRDHSRMHDTSNAISVPMKLDGHPIDETFINTYVMIEGVCAYDEKTALCYLSKMTRIAIRPMDQARVP